MAFAMTLFVSAASGQLSTGQRPLTVQNRKQGVRLFASLSGVTDRTGSKDPLEQELDSDLFRAFLIVWEHYRDDAYQASIAARLLGFYRLMTTTRGEALEAWTQTSSTTDETVTLHPRVVEVIAAVPLTREGKLDEARFLNELKPVEPMIKQVEVSTVWPVGEGEMAQRVRAFAWAATSLGPITTWPQSLRTAIDLALACRFPMIVLWGANLIQIYNDGYRSLMGVKHPAGLGQPTRECWPEVWNINEPIYTRVRTGETVTIEDGLYPITRSGQLEDAYFTLCYSALRDEAANVAGILVTVFETTERVLADLKKATSSDLPAPLHYSVHQSHYPGTVLVKTTD